jgi:hypothetical protein
MLQRIATCVLLLTAFAAAETFEDKQTKTFDFKPGTTLRFGAEYGHLDVRTGNVSTVQLETYRRVETPDKQTADQIFKDLAVESKPQTDGLDIRAFFKEGWVERDGWDSWENNRGPCMSGESLAQPHNDDRTYCLRYGRYLRETRYTLTIPKKVNLYVKTRAGHISIDDVDGPVNAWSAGGHISVGHVGGEANIQTAGGHITVQDSTGPATLKTAGGHIKIGDVGGNLIATTAGGHIEAGHVKGSVKSKTAGGHISIAQADGAVEAKTVGGNVTARIAGQPKEASYLESSAGSVNVELSSTVKVDVDAESSGGSISSDFELERPADSDKDDDGFRWRRGGSARGKVNGGGPRLELRTTHGRIRIAKATFQY